LVDSPRRFPPPWSIEEHQESFIVKDANGKQLAYLYFEDEPQRKMSMKRLSRDEAFLIAANIHGTHVPGGGAVHSIRSGHSVAPQRTPLWADIVEKVGFRLGLCRWGGFLKHSIAGDVDADATETSLAVSGK
jgi:hypothetical protein